MPSVFFIFTKLKFRCKTYFKVLDIWNIGIVFLIFRKKGIFYVNLVSLRVKHL